MQFKRSLVQARTLMATAAGVAARQPSAAVRPLGPRPSSR